MDTKRRNQTAQMVLAALATRTNSRGDMFSGTYAAEIAVEWANDLEKELESATREEFGA